MKKAEMFLIIIVIGMTAGRAGVLNASEPGLIFHCSYNDSLDADYSKGSGKAGYDVKISKGQIKLTTDINGKTGECVYGGGQKNTLVYKANDGNFNVKEGTLEMWVKFRQGLADARTFDRLIEMYFDKTNYLFMAINPKKSSLYVGYVGSGKNIHLKVGDAPDFGLNKWHHITVTWDSSTSKMAVYRDKEFIRQNTAFKAMEGIPEYMYIGSSSKGFYQSDCYIDELKIFDRAKGKEEIEPSSQIHEKNKGIGKEELEFPANAALGGKYVITTERPFTGRMNVYTDEKGIKLTDGIKTNNHWREKKGIGWIGQGKVTVIIDLEDNFDISELKLHFIGGGDGGVYFPERVDVYSSVDKQRWEYRGAIKDHPEDYSKRELILAWLILDLKPKKTRYVKMIIKPQKEDCFAMLDEVELIKRPLQETRGSPVKEENIENVSTLVRQKIIPVSKFKYGHVYFYWPGAWSTAEHMLRMRKAGFNVAYSEGHSEWGHQYWKDIEPIEGEINWAPLDNFVNNAERAGLYTWVFLALDSQFPEWVIKKYPDAKYVNPYGETIPRTACYYDEGILNEIKRLYKAAAKRYKGRPNVLGYVIGDEYGIYLNYYSDKNFYGQDFGECARKHFHKWLKNKYKDIKTLNMKWNTGYEDFGEIKLSTKWFTEPDSHKQKWHDWCIFREDKFADVYHELYKAIKSVDSDTKVALSAICPMWPYRVPMGGNLSKVQFLDAFARKFDTEFEKRYSTILFADQLRGLRNKETWFSNFNLRSHDETPIPPQEHVRHVWEAVGRGVKGIIYFIWQSSKNEPFWRIGGKTSSTFIYGDKEGNFKATQALRGLQENNEFLGRYGDIIAETEFVKPEIALLDPGLSYIHNFWYNIDAKKLLDKKKYTRHPHLGKRYQLYANMHKLLIKNNYLVDSIAQEDIRKNNALERYKVLVLAGCEHIYPEIAEKIKNWLSKGRSLIIVENGGKYDELGKERDYFKKMALQKPGNILWLKGKAGVDYPYTNGLAYDKLKDTLPGFLNKAGVNKEVVVSSIDENKKEFVGINILNHPKGDKIIILTNRDGSESILKNLKLKINNKRSFKNAFLGSPYPFSSMKKTRYKKEITMPELANVQVLVLTDRNTIDNNFDDEVTRPISAKAEWWNDKWHYRVPLDVRYYKQKAENGKKSLGARHSVNITKLLSEVEIEEEFDENSLRVIGYDSGYNILKEAPLSVIKKSGYNSLNKAYITISWDIKNISSGANKLYYLYFDTLENGEKRRPSYMSIHNRPVWKTRTDNEKIVISKKLTKGNGLKASYRGNSTIIKRVNISKSGNYNIFLRMKGNETKNQTIEFSVDNKPVLVRDYTICDYWRFIKLNDIKLESGNHDLGVKIAGKSKAAYFDSLVLTADRECIPGAYSLETDPLEIEQGILEKKQTIDLVFPRRER